LTWNRVGAVSSVRENQLTYTMDIPYADNQTGNRIYITMFSDVHARRGTWASTNGGSGWTVKYASSVTPNVIHRWGVASYTLDKDAGFFALGSGLQITDDGFDTYSSAAMTGATGTIRATGGFPTVSSQFYLVTGTATGNNGIYVSTDRGENWSNKTGNWKSVMGIAINTALATDRTVIVPLWTE
jgi:hypothetical protein